MPDDKDVGLDVDDAMRHELATQLSAVARALPDRINADPERVEQGLARLVLTLIEVLRKVLEHQAVRRMDGGGLSAEEVERLGLALLKLDEQARKDELRRVGTAVAAAAYAELSARAIASAQDPLPKPTVEQTGAAVLNASFLVAHDRIDDFRAAVTDLVHTHDHRGFRFEFTGPWPPYHFARSDDRGR